MSLQFGESAARCSTLAAQMLGWNPQEFWTATPYELALALRPISGGGQAEGPSREQIRQMIERERHG